MAASESCTPTWEGALLLTRRSARAFSAATQAKPRQAKPSCRSFLCSTDLDSSIPHVKQDIQDVVAEFSESKSEASKARDKNAGYKGGFWDIKRQHLTIMEQQLRAKEQQLMVEKARKEALQQGTGYC